MPLAELLLLVLAQARGHLVEEGRFEPVGPLGRGQRFAPLEYLEILIDLAAEAVIGDGVLFLEALQETAAIGGQELNDLVLAAGKFFRGAAFRGQVVPVAHAQGDVAGQHDLRTHLRLVPGLDRREKEDRRQNDIDAAAQESQERRPGPADRLAIALVLPDDVGEPRRQHKHQDQDPEPVRIGLAAEEAQGLFQPPEDELAFLRRGSGFAVHGLFFNP